MSTETPPEHYPLRDLVAWLADPMEWNWTNQQPSARDAADCVLNRMAELGLIEGRKHPHTWGGGKCHVFRADGQIFGRTDGVDDSLFD